MSDEIPLLAKKLGGGFLFGCQIAFTGHLRYHR